MIQTILSSLWSIAVANHLWQSTLFAAVAGLLTLALRKNQARARYWLWMAASVKLLIPFSWLVTLGSRISWARTPAASTAAYVVIEEVSQPFTRGALPAASMGPAASHALGQLVPSILASVWLCGFVAVVLMWIVRWRQISTILRSAVPMREGREVEALRRIEQVSGLRTRIELLLSGAMLEPGIFGMTRPVLVWPEGISERLENPHLDAILAHELLHVRRRDNLAAACHMLVEAVFWFHPLVWWLGARLIDERERACDEEVLEFGSDRHVYAESILKVCEFCVGSPLACVSGITGADLKKRMVHIMSEHVVRKLDFGRKLLLSTVASLAIALPIVFGLSHATPTRAQSQNDAAARVSKFDSVSIKPSVLSTPTYDGGKTHMVRMMFGPAGYMANNVTMRSLIQEAYGVQANQILGPPELLDSTAYDIEARTNHAAGAKEPVIEEDERAEFTRHEKLQHMLQGLLAEHAKLALHGETKTLPSYVLTVGDGGSKLQPANHAGETINLQGDPETAERNLKIETDGRGRAERHMFMQSGGDKVTGISASGVSMEEIVRQFSMQLGVNVIDKTGLTGSYDFNLHWSDNPDNTSAPSFPVAVQEQLGLKLQQVNEPTQVLVIDHIEQPEEVTGASR